MPEGRARSVHLGEGLGLEAVALLGGKGLAGPIPLSQLKWGEKEEPREGDWVALVMGYGMIYSHAQEPNAAYPRAVDRDLFSFYALRASHPGEQICISYGEDWWKSRDRGMPG